MGKRGPKPKSENTTLSSRLKSRKLLVGIVCLASGVVIDLLVPRGLSDNLLTLLIAILGIYVTGNVGAKAAKAIRQTPSNPAPQNDTRVDRVQKDVADLKEAQGQYEQYLSGVLTTVDEIQKQIQNVSQIVNNKRSQ